jgi:hypothetical protein
MTEPMPGATPPPAPASPEDTGAPAWGSSPGATDSPSTTPAGSTPAAAAQAMSASMLGRMSLAEQLSVLGAVLLLLVEVVTGLLLDEYFAGDLVSLLAIAILVAAFVRYGRNGDVPLGYVNVLRIAGFAIGLIAVSDLVIEVRRGVFDNVIDIVGGLAYYAGAVLVTVGAFQLKERPSQPEDRRS